MKSEARSLMFAVGLPGQSMVKVQLSKKMRKRLAKAEAIWIAADLTEKARVEKVWIEVEKRKKKRR